LSRNPNHPAAAGSLDDLRPGGRALIAAISGDGPLVQRLMQLGLLEGTEIEMIRRAPAGDPLEFRVLGDTLCLRASEARMITIWHIP
jgi:Fe2+ transport system protein FeoA